ncbi:MAG: hypothetical protein ABWZ25_11105 [Chitinophagaceae bacterium]
MMRSTRLKAPATLILVTLSMGMAAAGMILLAAKNKPVINQPAPVIPEDEIHSFIDGPARDSIASVIAFAKVYKVLMSPRCMNCHPSGDIPLQGDYSQLHTMGVKRGPDGKGLYAEKCSNCHQPQNTPGKHTPPGNPKWALPPADMKMVFQGRTPRQLALQLLNPNENGHKTKEQLIEHVTSDTLVLGGWNPGEGRTLPPMSHKEFAVAFRTWIETGAYAPKK